MTAAFLLVLAATAGSPADWVRRMEDARAAVDGGRPADAVAIYESMVEGGVDDPALWYNLGNARFLAGEFGRAVAAYRRAWRLTPRDRDILRNLSIAADRSGAELPRRGVAARLAERLSPYEWRWAVTAGWWFAWLAAALGLWPVAARRAARRAAFAAAAWTALAGAALAHWRALEAEHVVVEAGVSALYAPLDTARPHMPLPVGSIVEPIEERGEWIRVRAAGREGWIRSRCLEPVRWAVEGGGLRAASAGG